MALTGGTSAGFEFSSAPKAAPGKRSSATATPGDFDDEGVNIMADPRVMRGSTYSLYRKAGEGAAFGRTGESVVPGAGTGAALPIKKKKKRRPKANASIYDYRPPDNLREEVDLTEYLVEQPVTVETATEASQTDEFKPKPPPPPFVPKKTGVDGGTTMGAMFDATNPANEDPFDFDREVVPLLDVLCGKTLHLAMLEAEHEHELEAIAAAHAKCDAAKRAEQEREAAMEAASEAEARAVQRRKQVARDKLEREKRLARKLASLQLVRQLMPHVVEQSFGYAEKRGQWVSPTVHDVRADFLPWLYGQVEDKMAQRKLAEDLAANVVEAALSAQRAAQEAKAAEVAAKAAAAAAAAAAEKEARDAARTTLISIRYLENSIGPISVLGATTVAELETKVIEWITDDETLGMEAPQAGFLRLAVAGVPVPGETRVMDLPTGADQPLEAMVTEPAPAEAAAAADGEAGGEAGAAEE